MSPNPRDLPEQEHSIKEREEALYQERRRAQAGQPALKPFPVYLRETPASPLAPEVKVLLWIVGVVVAILFVAALWRVQSRPRKPVRPRAEAPAEARPEASGLYPQPRPDGTMTAWQSTTPEDRRR